MCKIGNGYGVSNAAESVYEDLISRWQDVHMALFVHLTHDSEITSRLQMSSCNSNYRKLAKCLIDQATNPNVKLALEFISNFSQSKLEQIRHDSRFQTILKTVTVKK